MTGQSSPATGDVRVVVVDDQPLIRQALVMLLHSSPGIAVAGQGADGAQAMALVAQHGPEVAVVKAQLPQVDGVDATAGIVNVHPATRVLMLTASEEPDVVAAAFAAGASGCIAKDASPEALISAVRVMAAGESLVVPRSARSALEAGLMRPRRLDVTPSTAHLTPRERDILHLVGLGLANSELAAQLGLAEPTVKSHVSRLRHRLGLRDRAQMVVCAYELGLVAVTSSAEKAG